MDARNKVVKTKMEQDRQAMMNAARNSDPNDGEHQPISSGSNRQEGEQNIDVLRGPNSLDVSMYSAVDTEKAVLKNTYLKAYADLSRELFGDFGYSFVTVLIFLQSMM